MAFDYNSRTRWEKEKIKEWEEKQERKIRELSSEKKELLEEIGKFSSNTWCGFPRIRKWAAAHLGGGKKTLYDVIWNECADLI